MIRVRGLIYLGDNVVFNPDTWNILTVLRIATASIPASIAIGCGCYSVPQLRDAWQFYSPQRSQSTQRKHRFRRVTKKSNRSSERIGQGQM